MKKKFIKYLLILTFSITFIIFYEITNISTKNINRKLINIDINNARNPQIKKSLRFFDNVYTYLLLKFNQESQSYYINKDNRDVFPEQKIIYKTNKFSENIYPTKNNGKSWHRNYGNSASNRFSNLKLINKNNIKQLDLFWEHTIDDNVFNDIQSNVIVAENKVYIPSYNKKIISLDAKTGKKIWELKLDDYAPRRGMLYVEKKGNQSSKLLFSSYKKLIAINATDGTYVESFGKKGKVQLKKPSITSPALYEDNLVITTSEPSLEVYDLQNGKLKWKFILMKKQKKRNGKGMITQVETHGEVFL